MSEGCYPGGLAAKDYVEALSLTLVCQFGIFSH